MAGINQFLEGRGKDIQPVNLDGITSETEMNQVLFDHTQQKLRVGGYISPTEGAIKPVTFGNNIEANITKINDSVLNYKGPTGFDGENADYKQSRYDFITAEEDYRSVSYDLFGVKHIGHGINLEANKNLVMEVLNLNEAQFTHLYNGQSRIDERQGRALFERAIQDAERVVAQNLEGVPINASQRVALVSLAYNAPALIGPNLVKAVKAGDAAAISYEILNRSNGGKIKALDARRKREHDMFFGYDNKWTSVTKGDDLRDSGFSIASIFGISTAKADELNPNGRADMYQTTNSATPNKLLSAIAVGGHEYEVVKDIPMPTPRPERGRLETGMSGNSPEAKAVADQMAANDELRDMALPKPRPKRDIIKWNSLSDVTREVFPNFADFLLNTLQGKSRAPAPGRAFMQYKAEKMSGVNLETEEYGNDYFNPNEMETLKNFLMWLESQGKTSAQYSDYDTFFGIREVNGMYLSEIVGSADGINRIQSEYAKRGIKRPSDLDLHAAAYGESTEGMGKWMSMVELAMDSTDPVLALGLTIGRFSFKKDENGKYIIEDTYDFTGMKKRKAAYHQVRGEQDDRGKKPAFKFKLVL